MNNDYSLFIIFNADNADNDWRLILLRAETINACVVVIILGV